jgi:hypothetical protein
MRYFPLTFSNVSRLSPSSRCATAADNIYKSLDTFNKHAVSLENNFPVFNPTYFMVPVTLLNVTCIVSVFSV